MYLEVVSIGHQQLINRVRQLLRQLFASKSILQLVSSCAIDSLEIYIESHVNIKLTFNISAFDMIIQNLTMNNHQFNVMIESSLKRLTHQLTSHFKNILQNLILNHTIVIQCAGVHLLDSRTWEIIDYVYDKDSLQMRSYYDDRDIEKFTFSEQVCQKYYKIYKKNKLTRELMTLWCLYLICLDFHKMLKVEEWNDVFSAILCNFETISEVVIYDIACQLVSYYRSHESKFFRNILFAIDEMHANGHSDCSQACFLSNYIQTRPNLLSINSNATEYSNSGLNRIHKSISYMNKTNAILYTHIFLSVWNRKRERDFQKEMNEQAKRFEVVYEINRQDEI